MEKAMEEKQAEQKARPELTWPLLKQMFYDSPAEIARGCLQAILTFGGSAAPLTPEEENEVFVFLLEVGDEIDITVNDIVLRREARNVLARKFLPLMQLDSRNMPDGNIYGRRLLSVLNFWARSEEHAEYPKNKEYGELVHGVFCWAIFQSTIDRFSEELADPLARALVRCRRYELLCESADICPLAIPHLFFECFDRMKHCKWAQAIPAPATWFKPGFLPFESKRKESFCFDDLRLLKDRNSPEFISAETVAREARSFGREAGQTLLVLLHAWLRKNS